MPSGFLLEISNTNNAEVIEHFFREDPLPSGITIRARNTAYDYASFLTMAQTVGFTGSGTITDDGVSIASIFKLSSI